MDETILRLIRHLGTMSAAILVKDKNTFIQYLSNFYDLFIQIESEKLKEINPDEINSATAFIISNNENPLAHITEYLTLKLSGDEIIKFDIFIVIASIKILKEI